MHAYKALLKKKVPQNMLFLSAENMFFLSLQLLPTTGGITDFHYRYSMRESTDFHSLQLAKKEAMN
jgi:hypothetical protein